MMRFSMYYIDFVCFIYFCINNSKIIYRCDRAQASKGLLVQGC